MKELLKSATRPRVKDLLTIEIRRLETELLTLKPAGDTPKPVQPTTTGAPSRFVCDISSYGWDQSDKFVKLFVNLAGVENVPEANVQVKFSGQDVVVIVKDLDKKDHKLAIKNLLDAIVEEKSYHKVKSGMMVVYMLKVQPGKKWDYLTKTAKKVGVASKAEATEGMMDENPNAALMNIMKKMYETGDVNTKQMIEKAYTENMNKSEL